MGLYQGAHPLCRAHRTDSSPELLVRVPQTVDPSPGGERCLPVDRMRVAHEKIGEAVMEIVTTREAALMEEIARLSEEISRLREALNRYRYAHTFAGADSWDGGPDMRRRLEWAHSSDEGRFLTADQIAAIGKTFPARAALAPRPPEGKGE